MKAEHLQYIEENRALFNLGRRYNPEQLAKVFEIYNDITGEKKAKTHCARCLTNVIKIIIAKYEQETNNN